MKKGYTLVEILAVIIILGIVLGITVPILLGVYDKTKEDAYNKSVDNIILAAKYYVTENHLLYKDLDEFVITMQKLYDEKYLSYPQTNPIDETTMEGGIIVKRENAVLKYEYSDFLSGTP